MLCALETCKFMLKHGKLQSAYNELCIDVGTVLAVHKSFVFRLLINLNNTGLSD